MNTNMIAQWSEEILSCRLRTTRRKKRAQYNDFHKQLIALHKEERELLKQQRNLGWEPLVPPVQKGWKRCFVLRPDVARSKQAAFYEGILAKINTTQWSYRKDFKIKKRAFGRKKYVVKEQHLLKPDARRFQKLAFTEMEQQQFHEEWSCEKGRGAFIRRYAFNEPWRFVLKVQPNMIDKIRRSDPEIEARLHEIDNYLERNALRGTLGRLLDANRRWCYRKDFPKHTEVNHFKNKTLLQILDEIKNE